MAAPYCCLEVDGALVIRDISADHEKINAENESEDSTEEMDEHSPEIEMKVDYDVENLIESAWYSRTFQYIMSYNSCQWLNDDILTFKIYKRSRSNIAITSRVFFSLAKKRILGTIDDQIIELFMNDDQIIAFHSSGSVYRIILHPSYKTPDEQHVDEGRLLNENMYMAAKLTPPNEKLKFFGREVDFETPARKKLRQQEEIKK